MIKYIYGLVLTTLATRWLFLRSSDCSYELDERIVGNSHSSVLFRDKVRGKMHTNPPPQRRKQQTTPSDIFSPPTEFELIVDNTPNHEHRCCFPTPPIQTIATTVHQMNYTL